MYRQCKSESEIAEMHSHRDDNAVFLRNLSAFLLRSARVKIFLGLHIFLETPALLVATPTNYALHVVIL